MRSWILVLLVLASFGLAACDDESNPPSEPAVEVCGDGADNDGDGAVDCDDTDCAADAGCQAGPSCGDQLRNGTEACDGADLGGADCAASGFDGGTLGCAADCTLDTSGCTRTSCGNGVLDAGESCDDGNATSDDGCTGGCAVEAGYECTGVPSACATVCGDGLLAGDEACDDGNVTDGDGCSALCAVEAAACGDGNVDAGEGCDDGNLTDGDGCSALCTVEGATCGDGVMEGAEGCDDGNVADGDGCSALCTVEVPFCGDGRVDAGEGCDDDGNASGDGCNGACAIEAGFTCVGAPSVCTRSAACGDGRVDAGEGCDDGNLTDGDGCTASCTDESCGDGLVNDGGAEGCDDGDLDTGDGCDAGCAVEAGWDCSSGACVAECGDGLVVGTEGCDDAGVLPGDGCDDLCAVEAGWSCAGEPSVCATGCGDGITAGVEGCDDGNGADGDGCSAACVVERCGDGIANNGGEGCDDGDLDSGDGCDAACAVEAGWICGGAPSSCAALCGDGLIVGAELCDDGNGNGGDGCSAACAIEAGYGCSGAPSSCTTSCGDGVIAGAEGCDDGNGTATDGCDACSVTAGWSCAGSPSVCATSCGDGVLAGAEVCDDGNGTANDGCTACAVDAGFSCAGTPSACTTSCGDGAVAGAEGCDDGNGTAADGCDACAVEAGWSCAGSPSVCSTSCGDGVLGGAESCDDGNATAGDGCGATCAAEAGWSCAGTPSVCATSCGDGVRAGAELCDDGNLADGDCCSGTCQLEADCEREPNGTPADALASMSPFVPATAPGIEIKASIGPIGDIDYIPFTVPAAADVRIEIFSGYTGGAVCVGTDTLIELLSWDGASTTLVLGDDDDGVSLCSAIIPGADAAARGLPPGTYFVRVNDYQNNGLIPGYRIAITFDSVCGDGAIAGSESCDDGNLVDGDGCNLRCRAEVCGDGSVNNNGTEQCDDGNVVSGDGCDANCRPTACGNSIVTAGEQCDDGNVANLDGCSDSCQLESVCGDGAVTGLESCDDGNADAGDGCGALCGIELGYACVGTPSVCTPVCGDGQRVGSEQCDDGNQADGDGCSATCTVEPFASCGPADTARVFSSSAAPLPIPDSNPAGATMDLPVTDVGFVRKAVVRIDRINHTFAADLDIFVLSPSGSAVELTTDNGGGGDNFIGTIFDDAAATPILGALSGAAPFTGTFRPEGSLGAVSGQPITGTWGLRAADDAGGDTGSIVGWSMTLCVANCANGQLDPGETCEDDNLTDGDGCDSNCKITACGNGIQTAGEACDDGDLDNGDGCSSTCQLEAVCSDGVTSGLESCDDGNLVAGDGCSATCDIEVGYGCAGTPSVCGPVCGDGQRVGAEQCDDGNLANGDCCSGTCQVEAGCEVEPNGTSAEALTSPQGFLPLDSTMRGAIGVIGDQDYFAFTVPSATDIRLELFDGTGLGCASIDPDVALIAQDGTTVLLTNDATGLVNCGLIDARTDAAARRLAAGTYYVRVIRWNNSATIPAYRLQLTALSVCGDGQRESTEACDDANLVAGDGCAPDCTDELAGAVCPNAAVETGEECDDNNAVAGDGCDAACQREPACADRWVDAPETCDDGNLVAGDGCSSTCQTELVINEIDYNQAGTDTKSFIELFNRGTVPLDLSQFVLVLVNGTGNEQYLRIALSGTLNPGEYAVIGNALVLDLATVTAPVEIVVAGDFIQNGAPDGVALVSLGTSTLIDALSYQGSMTTCRIPGLLGTFNLVEGTPFAAVDTNDDLNTFARTPNGNDTNNAVTDWMMITTITPGAPNP